MNLIATSNPANETSADFTQTLAAGTYFLKIDGDGNPDPTRAGYSDYGSLGHYSIKVTPSQTTRTFQEGVGGYAETQAGWRIRPRTSACSCNPERARPAATTSPRPNRPRLRN